MVHLVDEEANLIGEQVVFSEDRLHLTVSRKSVITKYSPDYWCTIVPIPYDPVEVVAFLLVVDSLEGYLLQQHATCLFCRPMP